MRRGTLCCDRTASRQPRPSVGLRRRICGCAEEPRRPTRRSNAPANCLRVFDQRPYAVWAKEPAKAGDDGPLWQTSGASLAPLEGCLENGDERRRQQRRQMHVRMGCPFGDHGLGRSELHSVFNAQVGSSAALHEGGAAYHPDQRRRDSRRRRCSSIVPRKTGSLRGLGGWTGQ